MTAACPPSANACRPSAFGRLALGAIGVVYGDIGTSPLYALKECFAGSHPLALDEPHILGVLSLMFWTLAVIVSVKYVTVMLRADNRGEGGSLALLALLTPATRGSKLAYFVTLLGIFASALFYGDSMITPAISVLSAVEGLHVALPNLGRWVIPITLVILVSLLLIQRRGTHVVGALFGPAMCVWFAVIGALGLFSILRHPHILIALNPVHAVNFFIEDGWLAFLALGSVVLAATGCEALYADMGHFGRRPIRIAWFSLVFPALLLNYFGQGALLIDVPSAIDSPFYRLAPEWALLPLVCLATLATIIASQAVISGAFSVTRQAIQLGFLPRMNIVHTSESEIGQIYIPFVNWSLLVAVAALVIGFGSSSNLAAAYGVAVTGTMVIDSLLLSVVVFTMWKWNRFGAAALIGLFLTFELAYFAANLTKIPHGGWFPLMMGLVIFVLLTTWKRGRALLSQRLQGDLMPVETFVSSLTPKIQRVPGTAVFMTGTREGIPHALLHNLKHNKVLHERVVLLTVLVEDVPHVPESQRIEVRPLAGRLYRVVVHYGFMETPNVPAALMLGEKAGLAFDLMDTSFFLSRETLIPSALPGMALWREMLFSWMSRSAATAMNFFRLPPNRVVELGTQVEF
ncbi:MAG: potassium transporter Kup [Gemmatimonas sp.]